jgi:hypothetical protein
VKKLLTLTPLIALGAAGVAVAAGPTITTSVKPNKPKKGSSIVLSASGFSGSSLPSSLTVTLQKGFTTSTDRRNIANSTKVLCTTTQENNESCPQDSQIGQGTATGAVTGPIIGTASVPFRLTFFLGQGPAASNCPATVEVVFTSESSTFPLAQQHAIGNLCKHAGGLQLAFSSLPTYASSIPAGYTATLQQLTVNLGSSTTSKVKVKKRVRRHGRTVTKTVTKVVKHFLLNNPGTCPASRTWTGSLTIGFSTGPVTEPLTIACTK